MGGGGRSVRDRTRDLLRRELADQAFDMFVERGFESTTMDDLAAGLGLSRSTLFRLFPTKEDLVLGALRERGVELRDLLVARPSSEAPWLAIQNAFLALSDLREVDVERALRMLAMIDESPGLRARYVDMRENWVSLLLPEMARRCGVADDGEADPAARAIAAAALACLDAAVRSWRRSHGVADFTDLINRSMQAVVQEPGRVG